MNTPKIYRIAAFSLDNKGGNPAGVALIDNALLEENMLAIAHEVGYSETAFLHPEKEGWRVRYFSPEIEVDFCGHATIAAGKVLGKRFGIGTYKLYINKGEISLEVKETKDSDLIMTIQSPETWSKQAPESVVAKVLDLFHLTTSDLNTHFPVRYAYAGATHLILVLKDRQTLSDMAYDFKMGQALMLEEGLVTISLLWTESVNVFHSRNAFASGGIYEDPATGAAAAALAGYLRDINWKGNNEFKIIQGEDMGVPSHLFVEFTPLKGSSVKISGSAHNLE